MENLDRNNQNAERLLTFKQAAVTLGVGYHKIQRAARRGVLPVYRLGDSRKYVRMSDILSILAASAS